MQENSRFDQRLDNPFFMQDVKAQELIEQCTGHGSKTLKDALIFVADTLDTCALGAEAVFGKSAKPEHAIQLYDRVMQILGSEPVKRHHEEVKREAERMVSQMPESSIMRELREGRFPESRLERITDDPSDPAWLRRNV